MVSSAPSSSEDGDDSSDELKPPQEEDDEFEETKSIPELQHPKPDLDVLSQNNAIFAGSEELPKHMEHEKENEGKRRAA